MTIMEVETIKVDLSRASMADLAAAVERSSTELRESLVGALAACIRLGEALLVVRERFSLDASGFTAWCNEHGVSAALAKKAMRLAAYQDHIPSEIKASTFQSKDGKTHHTQSPDRAIHHLKGLPRLAWGASPMKALAPDVKKLAAQGMTWAEIGDTLGVSKTTVGNIIDPARYKRQLRRSAARRKQERDRAEAASQRVVVTRSSGDLRKAYAELRRCLTTLSTAATNSTPTTARFVDQAISAAHAAEAHLVEAMKAQHVEQS